MPLLGHFLHRSIPCTHREGGARDLSKTNFKLSYFCLKNSWKVVTVFLNVMNENGAQGSVVEGCPFCRANGRNCSVTRAFHPGSIIIGGLT